ncbi:MAG: N-6 DNA methylase [Candidatus Lokiarchaeota archaeon]|nr:N-6 DNA methylase [Candidatus Lokiarchaeota archaeon]
MVENNKIIDSKDISRLFGLRSRIFKLIVDFFKKNTKNKQNLDFKEKLDSWKQVYGSIYSGVLDKTLFFKHSYFSLILKSFFLIKLGVIQNLDFEEIYDDSISNDLEAFQIFEYEHFYWIDIPKKVFQEIYEELEGITFALQDLFIDLYQELFFADLRHKIGEFYTPLKLVSKMVEDFYEFGTLILDPSCGSGSFLTNIVIKILKTDNTSNEEKIEAINNVYGFDINPLAIFTAKINMFLIFLEYFNIGEEKIPQLNLFIVDSLFPEKYEMKMMCQVKKLYNSFDLVIGNPPWITYKDLNSNEYQADVRNLADQLEIKPFSQYITHIELGALFFYAVTKFLKIGGKVFFINPKSVLNGDHCFLFRSFSIFNDLEIWDFPSTKTLFSIPHICLKGTYIGKDNGASIKTKYPIKTKIFSDDIEFMEETLYSSLKIEAKGAKLILPVYQLKLLSKISHSPYKNKFHQGATLVPRTLVFFKIKEKNSQFVSISSDPDVSSTAKKEWNLEISERQVEKKFIFKSYLNKNLVPFCLKKFHRIYLPIDDNFLFDVEHLKAYSQAYELYKEINNLYMNNKKPTTNIQGLFDNLNYWNKLTKQRNNENYLVVYNASGSSLKSAVINNFKKNIIVPSENYYFSTDSKDEAYYLSAVLNAPIISKSIKIIKSSRHIHKRPFSFPLPEFDDNNSDHQEIARKGRKYNAAVQDMVNNNSTINANKVRMLLHKKLRKLDILVEKIVFK